MRELRETTENPKRVLRENLEDLKLKIECFCRTDRHTDIVTP